MVKIRVWGYVVGPPSPADFEADEQAYQSAVEVLHARYGSYSAIPPEELAALRAKYPLASAGWAHMGEVRKEFSATLMLCRGSMYVTESLLVAMGLIPASAVFVIEGWKEVTDD